METTTRHRIAIVVACHDDAATIEETLVSLRPEADSELVIVDDGSTDRETLRKLEEFKAQGVRVVHQQNAGPSAAWMKGLSVTTAPYVLPFSSDDILLPGAVKLLADALDADQHAGFAWGDMETFGMARAYRPSVPVLCPWLVTFTNCIPAYSLFRRSTLLEVGGWQNTNASEDWDLWMRLAAHGIRGVYVPHPIYLYRRGSGNRSQRRGAHYGPLYAELRERNAELFERRAENGSASPAPAALKMLVPLIDRLPRLSRIKKIQLSEMLTLLLWSAGPWRTARIIGQGMAFRIRLLLRAAG